MIRVRNERLNKSYDGFEYNGTFYFTKDVSLKIAEDSLEDLVFASYDKIHDSFDFCVNQFQSGDCLEFKYKGRIIDADGYMVLVYPIGCDGALGTWTVVPKKEYMPNQAMVDEMIEMQKAYDQAVYKEFNCSFDREKCRLALIDEIGEFNHEVKKSWCYWKHTQKSIDREKALEELADVWHFALSLAYHGAEEDGKDFYTLGKPMGGGPVSNLYAKMLCFDCEGILEELILVGNAYDFSMEDVFEAYKKKNKINYERLSAGY